MATNMGGVALAERPTESIWPSPLADLRVENLPEVRAAAYLRPMAELAHGVLAGLPGAVTGLAVSRDGTHLVAAHYGQHAVSLIDTATLAVNATMSGIAEPYAVSAADRAYLRSASIGEDTVVAVDLSSGVALAGREIGVGAGGVAVSPAGELLYVGRSVDGVADIAVVDVESGAVSAIPVTRAAAASIDAVRINPAGTKLFAALTTAAGGALVVVEIRTGRVQIVPVGEAIGEIAVYDDRRVFVSAWDADQGAVLRVVDAAAGRVAGSMALDAVAVGILATGSAVYLAHGENVTVFDPANLRTINNVHLGRPVSCLAISRDASRLYVGDYDGAISALAVPALNTVSRAA